MENRSWFAKSFTIKRQDFSMLRGWPWPDRGQEGGISNEVSHLIRNSTVPQSYNFLKLSSPHISKNVSCPDHLKVFQGSHATPRVAWVDSSVELSLRFLFLAGKIFLLYRLDIVQRLKNGPGLMARDWLEHNWWAQPTGTKLAIPQTARAASKVPTL